MSKISVLHNLVFWLLLPNCVVCRTFTMLLVEHSSYFVVLSTVYECWLFLSTVYTISFCEIFLLFPLHLMLLYSFLLYTDTFMVLTPCQSWTFKNVIYLNSYLYVEIIKTNSLIFSVPLFHIRWSKILNKNWLYKKKNNTSMALALSTFFEDYTCLWYNGSDYIRGLPSCCMTFLSHYMTYYISTAYHQCNDFISDIHYAGLPIKEKTSHNISAWGTKIQLEWL